MSKDSAKEEHICEHFYVDIFGHPFCTKNPEEAIQCKYCLPSEEYKEMIRQQNSETYKKICQGNKMFQTPSVYRCSRLDHLADRYGHLPEKFRPKLQKGFYGITLGTR